MALGKTVATILSNKTAGKGAGTVLSECTTINTESVLMLGIQVNLVFNAAATGAATVKVFASQDDTNWNTNPSDQWDIPWVSGASDGPVVATLPAARYLRVQVYNNDAARDITAIYVYAHPLRG